MSLDDLSKCFEHPHENVRFHCEECKSLICDDCVIGNHKSHKIMKLLEYGANQRKKVLSYPDMATGTDIPNIDLMIDEAKNKNKTFLSSIQSQKDAIKSKRKMIDSILDELEHELTDCFKISEEDGQPFFDKFLQRQNDKKEKISKIIEEIKAKGTDISNSDVAFYGKALEELASRDPFHDNVPDPQIPRYVFHDDFVSKEKLQNMIGYVESSTYSLAYDTQPDSPPVVPSRQNIDKEKNAQCPLPTDKNYQDLQKKKTLLQFASVTLNSAISHIVPKGCDKAWLISNSVYDAEIKSHTMLQPKVIGKTLTESVSTACLGKDDILFVGYKKQSSLKGMEMKTNVLKRQSVSWSSSLKACSKHDTLMCISRTQTADVGHVACIKSDQGYYIRRYLNAKSTGTDIDLNKIDVENPVQIVENKDGEICILCSPESRSSWIILLHKNGMLKFKFPLTQQDGETIKYIGAGFIADGVTITVETGPKQIMVDMDGQFQQEDPLEERPTCSSVDETFNIWIGFEDGSVKVYRYAKEHMYEDVEIESNSLTQF